MTYFITLHSTKSEEIIGHVIPLEPMNMDKFDDLLRISWKAYQDQVDPEDFCIEDFVEWHNENYETKIDWVVSDFIQLSE